MRARRGCCFAGRVAIGLALGFAATSFTGPARAAGFPDHAVKIVVPFPAGGTADAMPRIVGEWLSRKWGQPVVIENHAGAGGNIGAEIVYKSAPDGYTLLSAPPPPLVVNQNLYPNLGFDPGKFEPIVVMAQVPNSLLVNPNKIKATSLAEFIDYLKQHPDTVTAATQGNGTTSHLTTELFNLKGGVKVRTVPYRGSAPALQDLLAGNVDMMFDNLGVSLPLVKAGKLRLLAVASAQPIAALPDAPTMASKLPGFESVAWYAIVAPPQTPKAIVEKINADVNEALRDPSVRERLKNLSAEIYGGSVAKTTAYMREEVERWNGVIKAAHITLR